MLRCLRSERPWPSRLKTIEVLAVQAEKPWLRTNQGFFFLGGYAAEYAALPVSLPEHRISSSRFCSRDASGHTEDYQTVTCLACQQVHLVNPTTGKVLGEDDE